jgi:hypothetical protein
MSATTTKISMLKATVIVSAILFSGHVTADYDKVIRLSEPVQQTAQFEDFGAPLDETVKQVSLQSVASDGNSYVGKSVRVNARVSKVCKKKGCFFIAQEGNSVVRIAFKDYSFFVPTDISGKRVTFVGEVIAREVTAEEADHLAEDLGTDGSEIEPGNVFEIVASSVRVPR